MAGAGTGSAVSVVTALAAGVIAVGADFDAAAGAVADADYVAAVGVVAAAAAVEAGFVYRACESVGCCCLKCLEGKVRMLHPESWPSPVSSFRRLNTLYRKLVELETVLMRPGVKRLWVQRQLMISRYTAVYIPTGPQVPSLELFHGY